jgi:hypothetical protein
MKKSKKIAKNLPSYKFKTSKIDPQVVSKTAINMQYLLRFNSEAPVSYEIVQFIKLLLRFRTFSHMDGQAQMVLKGKGMGGSIE